MRTTDPAMRATLEPANMILRVNFTISSLRVGMRRLTPPLTTSPTEAALQRRADHFLESPPSRSSGRMLPAPRDP
jgi:hypothetical protein